MGAAREAVRVELAIRQADGSLRPETFTVLPPNMRVMREMVEGGLLEALSSGDIKAAAAFASVFAVCLSRTDKERGRVEWCLENIEPDDMPAVIDVVGRLLGMEKKTASPNAESPSPQG